MPEFAPWVLQNHFVKMTKCQRGHMITLSRHLYLVTHHVDFHVSVGPDTQPLLYFITKKNERSSVNRLSDPCYMCYVTNFHVSALSWRLSIGVRGGSVSWTISLPCGFKLCGYQYISQTLTIFQIFSTDLWCVLILVTWVTEIELILEPWFN